MKNIVLFLSLTLASLSTHAYQYEVGIFAGAPDAQHSFVSDIIKERFVYEANDNTNITRYSSSLFYFAKMNGVQSAASIEVLTNTGSSSLNAVANAVNDTSEKLAVSVVTIGPPNEILCQYLAGFPDTVFIAGLSSDGQKFDDSRMPTCFSSNILFVSGLNAALTDLSSNQAWGGLVRLAVPYDNLTTPIGGTRSRSSGMAITAGKMALILRAYPNLRGAALIAKFFETSTVRLPALQGKVTDARALVDFVR